MNIPKLASEKSKQVVGHRIQSWTKRRRSASREEKESIREYGTERGGSSQLREELVREHVKDLENQHKAKKEVRALDKEFFLSVLESSATKRDARSYIQKFTPSKAPKPKIIHAVPRNNCGVNLGSFYGPAAVEGSPKFVQNPGKAAKLIEDLQLNTALVKIRAPQTLSDETIGGIGRTLSQLERLGLVSVVVVDCNVENGPPSATNTQGSKWRTMEADQANRIVTAIENSGTTGARLVDNVIGISEQPLQLGHLSTKIHVTLRNLLMTPLRRGVIPVIPCLGYTDITQKARTVSSSDVILALTREFAGLPSGLLPDEDPIVVQERMRALREEVSLDRLIILDPLGGIPASNRENGYHVFLNMEQEFESAKKDLLNTSQHAGEILDQNQSKTKQISDLGLSNPFSKFVEMEFGGPHPYTGKLPESEKCQTENWHHLQNLKLARGVLAMLPPTSSAILTTPEEAANSGKESKFQPARVGTRRQRNPLIHNLLTDKPVFSSSLPVGRLAQRTETVSPAKSITPTTFVKHGISVTNFPDPRIGPWEPPIKGQPRLTLTSSQIDLPRLVHLIEDSFGRKLDVQAYLDRVNDRIAGVIVAGEYEGGALLTWETPPGLPDDGSPEIRARMVPYLDKFAVLKKSQGNGGVADLIFKTMVRECFPDGVVWRSRKTNPVNKWYFERSRGTWKLPDTGWTMFWTTPELTMDKQRFHDYEGVCKSIEPSWADNKSILD